MDTARFEEAVRAHQRMVFSIALHVLHNRGLAEEMTQEVFLALLQHGGGIETTEHLVHWLRRVAARKCIDQIRRQKWRRCLLLSEMDGFEGPASGMGSGDVFVAARLQRLLSALPARTRVALVLRYQEDLDAAAIGRVLGASESAIKKHLRLALALLRQRLAAPSHRHSLSLPGASPPPPPAGAAPLELRGRPGRRPLAAPGSAEWTDWPASLPGGGMGPGREPHCCTPAVAAQGCTSASISPPRSRLGRRRAKQSTASEAVHPEVP